MSPASALPRAGSTISRAARASAASAGRATAFGHEGGFGPYDAALINGTAAHGEDYDDTFEGGPVHAAPSSCPPCWRPPSIAGFPAPPWWRVSRWASDHVPHEPGRAASQHKSFVSSHAVFARRRAAGVAAALAMPADKITHASALRESGSASSNISADFGSWTKRLHAGAAAASGNPCRASGRGRFNWPSDRAGSSMDSTRLAPSKAPDFAPLLDRLGMNWVL